MGDLKTLVDANFNGQILSDLGEYVNYYSYSPTYDTDYGYLLERTEPSASSVKIMIATFTQKDKEEYDLGNLSVDDHKGYIPSSVTPAAGDEILRSDGERYKVLNIMHQHSVGGVAAYTTVVLKRRP